MPQDQFPQRETLQFWGRPSDGIFRKVAVVQDDAKVIAHVSSKIYKALEECLTTNAACIPPTPEPTKPKRNRDRFPNTGEGQYAAGRYGLHRTIAGHALSVRRCLRALKPIANTFDCLYVTGLSGLAPAAVVAYFLKKDLLILRKSNPTGDTMSHGCMLEGQEDTGTRYLILDDFVSNGGTLRRLLEWLPKTGTLVGVMLYGHPRSPNEIDEGVAKIFHTYKKGSTTIEGRWHLIRRGRNSMLFDIMGVKDQ